jgi:hypothetical protein
MRGLVTEQCGKLVVCGADQPHHAQIDRHGAPAAYQSGKQVRLIAVDKQQFSLDVCRPADPGMPQEQFLYRQLFDP